MTVLREGKGYRCGIAISNLAQDRGQYKTVPVAATGHSSAFRVSCKASLAATPLNRFLL
jgi:hypothetical protein